MSYQKQSFGMMDEGYFVPRGEILNWLNDLLKLNLTKIQQLGSGAVYCQVVDVIHPGKVALAKVNWKAKNDYEFINNLKILQNAFDKVGIKRHVQVQKLAKANLFNGQKDISIQIAGKEERRGNVQVDLSFADKTVIPKTYNSSGVVKNQSSVVPEKTQKVQKKKPQVSTTSTVKQQQGATRLKSPTETKRFQTKQVESTKKIQQKPKQSKTQVKQVETETQIERHIQQKQQHRDHQLEQQLKKAFDELQQAKSLSSSYQQKAKQAQMKLQMIKQILSTEDDAAMKISLIEEIFKQ